MVRKTAIAATIAAAGFISTAAPAVNAAVIYRENFTAANGTAINAASIGWDSRPFNGTGGPNKLSIFAAAATTSGLANVNAVTVDAGTGLGAVGVQSNDNRSFLGFTTEYQPITQSTLSSTGLSSFAWQAGSFTVGTQFRLAVHQGATDTTGLLTGWYISGVAPTGSITTALTSSLGNWSTRSVLMTTAWQTTSWQPLTVANLNDATANNDLGTAAALPAGNITAFGLYVAGGPANYLPGNGDPDFGFDNYTIAIPEPASIGLLGLVGLATLSRRRR